MMHNPNSPTSAYLNASQPIPAPPSSSSTPTPGSKKPIDYLPEGYLPGPWDVICQRGKDCHDHVGNRRFRMCVENYVEAYINSKTRQDKSAVISNIVKAVQEGANGHGGFVMKDTKTNRWHHVDNKVARDKVGNALRDAVKLRQDQIFLSQSNAANIPKSAGMNQLCVQQSMGMDTMMQHSNFDLQQQPTALTPTALNNMMGTAMEILPPEQVQQPFHATPFLDEKTNDQVLFQLHQLKMQMANNNAMVNGNNMFSTNYQQPRTLLDNECFSLEGQDFGDTFPGATSLHSHSVGPSRMLSLEALSEAMDTDYDFEPRPIASFR